MFGGMCANDDQEGSRQKKSLWELFGSVLWAYIVAVQCETFLQMTVHLYCV